MTAHTAARGPAPDDVVTTTALVKTYRQGTDEVRVARNGFAPCPRGSTARTRVCGGGEPPRDHFVRTLQPSSPVSMQSTRVSGSTSASGTA